MQVNNRQDFENCRGTQSDRMDQHRFLNPLILPVFVLAFSTITGGFALCQENQGKTTPALEELKTKFDLARQKIEKPLRNLNENYEKSLNALLEKVQGAGRLEKTLEVKNEIEGFSTGKTVPAKNFDELARLQEIYARERKLIDRSISKNLIPVATAHKTKLEKLSAELTKANKLENAIAVAEEQKKIQSLLDGLSSKTEFGESGEEKKREEGLLLSVGDKVEVWKNKEIDLPGQTPIYFSGTIQIPSGNPEKFYLRSERGYGSDRLKFTVAEKELPFEIMDSNQRFVEVEVPPGKNFLPIVIGHPKVSNAWIWGPLQWSTNKRTWRNVPSTYLSHDKKEN